MSWDFIKGNLQEGYSSNYRWLRFLFKNFTSHAIKRRQHSIQRDADLCVVIECLKKYADILRSKQANNHRDLQIILKLLSSRQHEQRAGIIPPESLRVTQQMLVLRSSAQKCSMAVSDDDNTILILFSGQQHRFQSDRAIDICSQARAQNVSSVEAKVVAHWNL